MWHSVLKTYYSVPMKRVIILSLCVLMVACTPSPQKKAETLIKEALLKDLVLPDTYEPVETTLDSAFAPYHDPTFVNKVLDLVSKNADYEQLQEQLNRAKSNMAIWSGPYMTAFGKEQYRQAKDEFEATQAKIDALTSRLQKIGAEISDELQKEPVFIGCRAYHRYRANNNAGNTLLGGEYFLFDKDVTTIISRWDEDEINIYNEFLKQVSELTDNVQ